MFGPSFFRNAALVGPVMAFEKEEQKRKKKNCFEYDLLCLEPGGEGKVMYEGRWEISRNEDRTFNIIDVLTGREERNRNIWRIEQLVF